MERVKLTIGPVAFDYAVYDAEHDVLYLHVGKPERGVAEATPRGPRHPLRAGHQRIVGLTVLGPRRILEHDGPPRGDDPRSGRTTADDLAAALAAA